jgi:YggT family protein
MSAQIGVFLVNNVLGLFVTALMLRFMMQWVQAPFANPLGHLIRTLTNWLVRPLHRLVPSTSRNDLGILLLVWLALVLKTWLVGLLTIPVFGPLALAMVGVVGVLKAWLQMLWLAVVVNAVLSWIAPHNEIAPVPHLLCEPVLQPVRRILPATGNIDLSPLVVLLIGQMLLGIVLPTLEHNLLRTLL